MQKFVVAPTELTRETPYLRHHIAATRQAWGLDSVEVRELGGEAGLTLADIRANAPTIENVRLWDRDPLLRTFGQLQEIRTYYDFVSVDDDRYWIDGNYRQVLLSPRELNVASLPTRTFINEHLTFTHGMGLTLSPGQPGDRGRTAGALHQGPAPGVEGLAARSPARRSITERSPTSTSSWALGSASSTIPPARRTSTPPTPAPAASRSAISCAELVLAVRFGSYKILLSQDITNQSRVLYYRNIVARARKALPFLQFDRDPYLVIGGRRHTAMDPRRLHQPPTAIPTPSG